MGSRRNNNQTNGDIPDSLEEINLQMHQTADDVSIKYICIK